MRGSVNVFTRAVLAGLMLVHAASQVMMFWRATQIISPAVFPAPVILANLAMPMATAAGAILLAFGLKVRSAALALMLFLACDSVIDLLFVGRPASALGWFPRLTVTIGLLVPLVTGGGRLSVDAVMEARAAIQPAPQAG